MTIRRRCVLSAAALLPWAVRAQHGGKPIRMIIPFAAGGATDVLGRSLGESMAPHLGQAFVIENMGGGVGVPAVNAVVRAAPDGRTIFFCASGNITAQPLLARQRIDILSQLAPVGMVASAPHVLVVSDRAPFRDVPALIAYARTHPGAINFGSAGVGGLAHLGTELFARSAGIRVTHIPYKGAAQVMTDLVAGYVHAIFGTMPSFTGMLSKGGIRAVGITAPSKAGPLQNLPLLSRVVPGFSYASWNGIFVPAKTPAALVDKLHAAMQAAARDPKLMGRFDEQGVEVSTAGPTELRALVCRESAVWEAVIRDAQIELN